MRGHNFGIRRQDCDYDADVLESYGEDGINDDQVPRVLNLQAGGMNPVKDHKDNENPLEMPHLLNSSSSSSSMSIHPEDHEKKRGSLSTPHQRYKSSTQQSRNHNRHNNEEDEHRNNRILRGAEILRKQLLAGQDPPDGRPINNQNDENFDGKANNAEGLPSASWDDAITEDDEDDDSNNNCNDDGDEWSDPWGTATGRERAVTVEGDEVPGTKSSFSFSGSVGDDPSEWAGLSDDEGDDNVAKISPDSSPKNDPTIREQLQNMFSNQTAPHDRMDKTSIHDRVQNLFSQQSLLRKEALCGSARDIRESPSGEERRNYLPGILHSSCLPRQQENAMIRSFEPPVSQHTMDLLKDLESSEEHRINQTTPEDDESSYLLEPNQDTGSSMMRISVVNESPKFDAVVSPRSPQYEKLRGDPAYQHAQRAGMLWQSLLSQHVRFPKVWWNGARSPPMGIAERRTWTYMGRHRVGGNQYLNQLVQTRGSAGRLVLHVVVRDIVTMAPVQDIAVGCFHPNARGVRKTSAFDPLIEDSRDIWVAHRKRTDDVSVMDSLLKLSDEDVSESPLGGKHAIDNFNMRAVFGETPPAQTVFVLESELYEVFSHFMDSNIPPAAILLGRYLKDWY